MNEKANKGSDVFGRRHAPCRRMKVLLPVLALLVAALMVVTGGFAMAAGIVFGAENVFNSASTNYISTTYLTPTKFVVAYRDGGNSNYGTAVIGDVSGNTITYGSGYVFNPAATYYISASALSSTQFVVAYRDTGNSYYGTAIIGDVSGNTITYGSGYVFNPADTYYISASALSSTQFVVAYRDIGNSYYGTAIIGDVSGNTITYGSEYVFNSADTYYISASALSPTQFVVAYRDTGNSGYGTAIIGDVSGDTITYGSEYDFNSASTYNISASALSPTQFVVAYRDMGNSNYGTAIIGDVSGNTITYGSGYVFNPAATDNISASALSSTQFVVAYRDIGNSDYGTAIIGDVSGNTITYGSEYVFNSATTNDISALALSSTKFAVAYRDVGNSGYGTAMIGTLTPDQYTLTVNTVGNGSVVKDPDQATYTYGTPVELTANADPGWTFDSWSGDLTGSDNPDTITMNGDRTVTATFVHAAPTITKIEPVIANPGSSAFTLKVTGTDFVPGSKVRWNGADRTTNYVSATEIKASITKDDLKTAGDADVTVFNPAPGGGISNTMTFTVGNTPHGDDETIDVDSDTTVAFQDVEKAGNTTRTEDDPDDPNFQVEGNKTLVACDVTTTATFKGWIEVGLSYPDQGSVELEKDIKLFHKEDGKWVDVTTRVDTKNNVVYGRVTTLSPFAVVIPARAGDTWYLAEGSSAWGFNCYITLANPNDSEVTADITYMTPDGLVTRDPLSLPALSQTTVVPINDIGRETDFSTKVVAREGKTIAVDRTMYWTGPGAPSPDGHSSIGVTSPATTWYLAEGSSAFGFDCWLLIQNPNDVEATATVTYMTEGYGPFTFEKKIPANSRRTYNIADDIGEKDTSIKVESDIPVIPERAMYRDNMREGHDSIGTTDPADTYSVAGDKERSTDFFLAEGTTDWGFVTYVLIENPNDTEAEVTVTYMTEDGPVPQAPFTMPAESRETIRVNDVIADVDLSTRVHADKPIIAERAMYWGEDTPLGEAAHGTIGMAEAHTTFYLPDGQTSDGHETYTLVQNPNDTDVEVEVTYLLAGGTDQVTFTETVTANSRRTFNMADKVDNNRASTVVTSKTSGKKIMCERAMYWNDRGAGTCTIGGYAD